MRTIDLNVTYKIADEEKETIFTFSDGNDISDIESEISTDEDHDIQIISIHCSDFPDANDRDELIELCQMYCECDQDAEVVEAAKYLDIPGEDIDEAYQGIYASDKDFAMETADQLGVLEENLNWPHNHIDWESAARDLMMVYSDHDGHYFRNL